MVDRPWVSVTQYNWHIFSINQYINIYPVCVDNHICKTKTCVGGYLRCMVCSNHDYNGMIIMDKKYIYHILCPIGEVQVRFRVQCMLWILTEAVRYIWGCDLNSIILLTQRILPLAFNCHHMEIYKLGEGFIKQIFYSEAMWYIKYILLVCQFRWTDFGKIWGSIYNHIQYRDCEGF